MKHLTTIAVAGLLAATVLPAFAADITGAGSTFVYPVLAKWADVYKKNTGVGLNYQSIGSGGGIKQITAKTVTFGATDMPLKSEDVAKNSFVQFPVINGAVVPLLNLPGIKPGELTLDGPTIAKIFLGEITKWNDPAIAKLNPGVKLPDMAIAVVHRSDGSGTTFIWTNYLSKVSPEWKEKSARTPRSNGRSASAPRAVKASPTTIAQTVGALGYVEYAYAKQNNLTYAKMLNHAGKVVAPTAESFQAAAASADWATRQDFRVIITDAAGRKVVAGRRLDLHPDANVPTDIASLGRSPQVLRLGLQERQADGDRSRLRADARQRRGVDREDLERQDQKARQARSRLQGVGKGAATAPFPSPLPQQRLVWTAKRPLE